MIIKTNKQLQGIFIRVVKSTLISELTVINYHHFPEKPHIWTRGQTPTGFCIGTLSS